MAYRPVSVPGDNAMARLGPCLRRGDDLLWGTAGAQMTYRPVSVPGDNAVPWLGPCLRRGDDLAGGAQQGSR
jgi:hypothetical protein